AGSRRDSEDVVGLARDREAAAGLGVGAGHPRLLALADQQAGADRGPVVERLATAERRIAGADEVRRAARLELDPLAVVEVAARRRRGRLPVALSDVATD